MNRADLIDIIAQESGLPKTRSADVLRAVENGIKNSLANGDTVTMVGFGTFATTVRQERNGRNPNTGETIVIPSTKTVRFSVGKAFKDTLNQVSQKPAEKSAKKNKK